MYVFEWQTFVKQVLPPHWRGTFKEKVLRALLYPLEHFHRGVLNYRRGLQGLININAQTASLEWHLNVKFAEPGLRAIECRHDDTLPGETFILVAEEFYKNKALTFKISDEVKKYIPFGIAFTIKQKDNVY